MKDPIALPMPPSVNAIWRRGKGKVVYLEPRYRSWLNHADAVAMAQKPLPKIKGAFTAVLTFDKDYKHRKRSDLDNRVKAVFDWLERISIIENDKHCQSLTAKWGYAPEGCRVELMEVE